MQTTTDVSSSTTTASRDEVQSTEGPDAERHALKRTYLTLLPHTQLVELCLAFEAHSPAHIKNSLLPANLAAAVAELQSPAQTSKETPHLSYNYPQTQPLPAYPHTPYYTPFSHSNNFPPHPPAPYTHTAYPPSQSSQASFPPFTGVPLARHPHPIGIASADHSGIPADDLPSYEDMLVEALTDLNEPDGSAPKSLFTWMASRYPLHSNFRPSASQALQKAFKRGRLEKGSNGKYRLNAGWDGGSTSKRTTRRPQTIGQSAHPTSHGSPTSSPFTHTPLAHAARSGLPYDSHSPALGATQGKPPHFPAYPYQYASGGSYPGLVLSEPPSVSKDKAPNEQEATITGSSASPQDPAGVNNAVNEDVEEGSDAWEAAQTILKAINFGSLLQASNPPVPAISPLPPSAPSGPLIAVSDARPVKDGIADGNMATRPVQVLSNRDRASLQAQLALLAAQLAEIAEDTLSSDLNTNQCGNNLTRDEEKG